MVIMLGVKNKNDGSLPLKPWRRLITKLVSMPISIMQSNIDVENPGFPFCKPHIYILYHLKYTLHRN
jgi:hypothetical protein